MNENEHEGEVEQERERVIEVSVEDEMKSSYMDYAMSVIVGRALPDARDGLKPVHRRILYGMHELGVRHDRPHKKSARIVGDVLGKYHPHGDVAVYDTMVRMAQDFSYRYPLVDGQGNFGSVDGDAAAAMRYTEARLSKIAEEMLVDLEKDTVEWGPNFDNTMKEPQMLPAKLPNLLINGSSGIAVGMATNMPPHNLAEVVDGIIRVIDEPEVSIEELRQIIKAPDFPTGGIIFGYAGIKSAYETGRGSIRIRAKAEIETKANRERIIIHEIPYQVNKSKLVEEIAAFAKRSRLESISGLRDESDREGMRIVVELKTGANASIVLNRLYKHTQLETTFGVINLALVDGEPRVLTLKELIECYIKHRKEVTIRKLQYELERAEKRRHILEGLIIAISRIDEVIKLIKASSDSKTAKSALMDRFALSGEQAKEILEMKLSRLSALERDKIETERAELETKIGWLKEVLASEARVFDVIKEELVDLKKKYGDARRTEMEEMVELSERDFIEEEEVILFFTQRDYVKRLPANVFKRQRRGGKGITVLEKKEGDAVVNFIRASTRERLIVFTESGRAYQVKTYLIPPSSRHAKGRPLVNIPGLSLNPQEMMLPVGEEEEKEKIAALIPVPEDLDKAIAAGTKTDAFIVFATKRGVVKRSTLANLKSIRITGIVAVKVDHRKGDSLADVALIKPLPSLQTQLQLGREDERYKADTGKNAIVIASRNGKAIVFHEEEMREMGRYAAGVRGMRLAKGDEIASIDAIDLDYGESKEIKKVVTITENGYGKRTRLDAYRETHRGGKGVIGIKVEEKTGKVVCIKQVKNNNDLIISTSEGMVTKISARSIPTQGRNTRGVRLMSVEKGERVVGVEVV
uniref:DNA gyrase subunit A n=1 Tax=Candidatus Methanophagaceae archaeon ANME-1 ERB6 TaxID=2759912 RepID=A0A7G9YXC4_9EURY|nr:DNA gyrase subunit A [Methanosarcinales archaeon ANME-1 ERB6]QNO52668.1 DNA gyrase subunit A [Methanosarcinales archaeon ANME-1 ERB6]